jgi:hypothetical protein
MHTGKKNFLKTGKVQKNGLYNVCDFSKSQGILPPHP